MRRITLALILVLMVVFVVAGCSKKTTVKADDGVAVDTETIRADGGGVTGTEGAADAIPSMDDGYSESTDVVYADIFFDYDKFAIKDSAKAGLRELAAWLSENDAKVAIEGHCDERGTNEYNLALGDRRANAAREFLIASGVPSHKLDTISYGEEKPQCDEKNESCWSSNRRAHFVILIAK